jgi:hypothetical protein
MAYQTYFGDLHSHCSISYGHGTAQQALQRARQQLDFCSVTGHAFWPDMPTDRNTYAEIIDYHNMGFAKLARNWDTLVKLQADATETGKFIAFPSYEWHSLKYGDHNVYTSAPEMLLQGAPDLDDLRQSTGKISGGGIAIPHHIGYAAGYRGINWAHYREDVSPFVEIFSLHGCSVDDDAPYPMLHDMGPRDWGSTAEAGWAMGHRFGIVGGTDHHGAYPGSWGDGRMGVFADSLTRESLWEAFNARRVYAATGDNIDARMLINDAWIGSSIKAPEKRNIKIAVRGWDAIDKVELIKNGQIIERFFPGPDDQTANPATDPAAAPTGDTYRLRITWGWGRKSQLVDWDAKLSLSDGTILDIDTCFSGQAVVAPKAPDDDAQTPDELDLPHAITERGDRHCCFKSVTHGNLTMRHATTQAISVKLQVPQSAIANAKLTLEVNGQRYEHPLAELLGKARSHYLAGWLSHAVRIGPLVSMGDCTVNVELNDTPDQDVDIYRLQVAQRNGQWAWLSPIWVQR